MCTLYEKHEEFIQHLFFECYNVLRIWSSVRQIFPTFQFSNKDDLLSFIKSHGSPLVKLIKLAGITFSIWMIWRMWNYIRFQDKIEVSRTILVIKDFWNYAQVVQLLQPGYRDHFFYNFSRDSFKECYPTCTVSFGVSKA